MSSFITLQLKLPTKKYRGGHMKDDLVLKKQLDIETHIVKATLARRKYCRFPKPLLFLLQEDGVLTPNNVASKLLCSLDLNRMRVAQLWIDTIFKQGLISRDDDGEMFITEEGKKYLEEGKAFVDEDNEWAIIYCKDDSRVTTPLIDIKEIKFSSFDERKEFDREIQKIKNNYYLQLERIYYGTNIDSFFECGNIIKTQCGEEFLVAEDVKNSLSLPSNNDMDIECLNNKLYIQWNVTKGVVSINYNGKDFFEDFLPEWATETEEEIVAQAVSKQMKWMDIEINYDRYKRLKVPFKETLPDETKRKFIINCPIDQTKAGDWDEVNVPVKVTPMTNDDAIKWRDWLFVDGIDKYLADKRFKDLMASINQKVGLQNNEIVEKNKYLQKLLNEKQITKEKKMFIQASLDWNL